MSECFCFDFFFRSGHSHLNGGANLAIHLHGKFHFIHHQCRRVHFRPRGLMYALFLLAQCLPELFRDMRCERCQQNHQISQHFTAQTVRYIIDPFGVIMQGVYQFHDRADGSIEIVTTVQIGCHFLEYPMGFTTQIFIFRGQFTFLCRHFQVASHNAPNTIQKAESSFYAAIAPFQVTFRRSGKKSKEPCRIGTVLSDQFFGRNHIAF